MIFFFPLHPPPPLLAAALHSKPGCVQRSKMRREWRFKGACTDAFTWQKNELRGPLCCAAIYACCNIPKFPGMRTWFAAINFTYLHAIWQTNYKKFQRATGHFTPLPSQSLLVWYLTAIPASENPICFPKTSTILPFSSGLKLLFIVLEMQHLHVPSGYGTLNNGPCVARSMLSLSVGSRKRDEKQAFFLAL